MKRTVLACLLVAALAVPAAAAPRDDSPGRERTIVKKIVRVIKLLMQPLDDSPLIVPPHP